MKGASYWERRYRRGGDSGLGSRGLKGAEKATYVNALIESERIRSVVDWGCGDGEQLALLALPADYVGVEVSATAVARCAKRFPQRTFIRWTPGAGRILSLTAELALSMDVIFHLVDDGALEEHMGNVFGSAARFVLVHGTDYDAPRHAHVYRRAFTHLAPPGWRLQGRPRDPTVNGFYRFGR